MVGFEPTPATATAPSYTETTFIPTAPLRSQKRGFMEQCYAEFLCITSRIGLLGFVVRRHTQVQEISGSCGHRRLEIYFILRLNKLQQIFRPRIIADASTYEKSIY